MLEDEHLTMEHDKMRATKTAFLLLDWCRNDQDYRTRKLIIKGLPSQGVKSNAKQPCMLGLIRAIISKSL